MEVSRECYINIASHVIAGCTYDLWIRIAATGSIPRVIEKEPTLKEDYCGMLCFFKLKYASPRQLHEVHLVRVGEDVPRLGVNAGHK